MNETEYCLIHGTPLHYDMRSGFEICYQCERDKEENEPLDPPGWEGGFADNH